MHSVEIPEAGLPGRGLIALGLKRPCEVSLGTVTLCFQGPYYWVLKGSRALTIRSLEALGRP